MSIEDIAQKIKGIPEILDRRDAYALAAIVLVGTGSFFLGRLSTIEGNRPPVTIEEIPLSQAVPEKAALGQTAAVIDAAATQGAYVGSKNSAKYHLPTCPGAQSIAEANKVWFASKQEAERAGYSPAGNCKGI